MKHIAKIFCLLLALVLLAGCGRTAAPTNEPTTGMPNPQKESSEIEILTRFGTAMRLPEGCASWTDYIGHLDAYQGMASQPTFFAAHSALGNAGTALLGLAALCAVFTGLIGNYIALSRLFSALSDDGMLIGWMGRMTEKRVPRNAILFILAVSIVLPFLGRTAISWIVDETTVGATIAYAFASASAWKTPPVPSTTVASVRPSTTASTARR